MSIRRRRRYTDELKAEVAAYARQHGDSVASRGYDIPVRTIWSWRTGRHPERDTPLRRVRALLTDGPATRVAIRQALKRPTEKRFQRLLSYYVTRRIVVCLPTTPKQYALPHSLPETG